MHQHLHQAAPPTPGGVVEFFADLFKAEFVPRADCMLGRPEIIWLHVVSDALIALAYFSIPLALFYFVRRRRDLSFHWMFILFGVFILACGTTHVMGVLAIWMPLYRLDGVVKAVTAVASVLTAATLWPLIPKAIQLPSPTQLRVANQALESEVALRRSAEDELRIANAGLESRVRERTRELAESEQRLRAVFNQAAVGITQVSPEGRWLMVNDRLCQMLGYTRESLLGAAVDAFCHPADRAVLMSAMAKRPSTAPDAADEIRLLRADARMVWVAITQSEVGGPDGQPQSILIVQDVTQRRAIESELANHRERLENTVRQRTAELEASHRRLRVSERMASIGTLSAGLGHDMGNLLFPLRVRLESMRARGIPNDLSEDLAAIENTCDYLAQLSRGLKQLAIDPEALDGPARSGTASIAAVWEKLSALLRSTVPRSASLETRLAAGLPEVAISAPGLNQILMNLVQNAADAVRERDAGQVLVWAEPAPSPGWVRFGVTDNGVGMSQEVLERCQEPFFSTKTRGMSTGLGLALVQGLAQRAGGRIDIASVPGAGTTVAVTLPSAQGTDERAPEVRHAAVRLQDTRIAQFISSMLAHAGYVLAPGGSELPATTSILVLDESSPDLTSALAFAAGHPDRRVLLLGDLPIDGPTHNHPQFMHLGSGFKPTVIAQALKAIGTGREPRS
ncbi:MAG: PAS domain S-box protein [Phycisphaerales bacterium]|nr:PAS domain S-box protein [Phycisphaerales bacterium]